MARGLSVTQIEQLPEVLPTVDPELGLLVRAQLVEHGVHVMTGTAVRRICSAPRGSNGRLAVVAESIGGRPITSLADLVLVVVGVRPDTELAASAGAELAARGAISVDRQMRTNLPGVFAAGECVVTHHRLLGESYLPLVRPPQSRGAWRENALGGTREFAGSLGTQVVKNFDMAAARTGIRDHEARAAGYDPVTSSG